MSVCECVEIKHNKITVHFLTSSHSVIKKEKKKSSKASIFLSRGVNGVTADMSR